MVFIKLNESFVCQNCGKNNPELSKSCRNHCRNCLFSLHLDENGPGDRQSSCHGLMEPVKIEHNGKKGWMITHKCQKCGKTILNKAAEDDNFEEIVRISSNLIPPRE